MKLILEQKLKKDYLKWVKRDNQQKNKKNVKSQTVQVTGTWRNLCVKKIKVKQLKSMRKKKVDN